MHLTGAMGYLASNLGGNKATIHGRDDVKCDTPGTYQGLGCSVPLSSPVGSMGCQRDPVPPFTAPNLEQCCPAQRSQEGQAHRTQEWTSTVAG